MSLQEKRIIITGAASGIGKESAKILKERGATIVGFDRHEPSDYVDEYINVDLMDLASIDAAIAQFTGKADGLVNSAGVPPTASIANVMTVNFLALRRFTEGLIENLNDGASIVNIASLAGLGWPDKVPDIKRFIDTATFKNVAQLSKELGIDQDRCYFFSKEVLIVWTMQQWDTWRESHGLRINTISPGPVDTPILQDFLDTLGERAEEDMKTVGRAGTPQDIAKAVAFLCSDDSAWINGANIPVDGGMYAHIMRKKNTF